MTRYIDFHMGFINEMDKEPVNLSMNYKDNIKGFHLAFNVHEPIKQEIASTYKFRKDPNLSADEIKAKVLEAKNRRIMEKREKENQSK